MNTNFSVGDWVLIDPGTSKQRRGRVTDIRHITPTVVAATVLVDGEGAKDFSHKRLFNEAEWLFLQDLKGLL